RNKRAVDKVISHLAKMSLETSTIAAKTDEAVETKKNSDEEKEELQKRFNLLEPSPEMSWEELKVIESGAFAYLVFCTDEHEAGYRTLEDLL
ncbi:hypothetical protein PFISCL1PPCAC_20859, partial [Pristionchus fissidentatus]